MDSFTASVVVLVCFEAVVGLLTYMAYKGTKPTDQKIDWGF